MKKIIIVFFMMLLAASQSLAQTTVVFDFTTAEGLLALGIAYPITATTSEGAFCTKLEEGKAYLSQEGVSLTAKHGNTPTRVWLSAKGILDFRHYKTGVLTFTAPPKTMITKIVFDGGDLSGLTTLTDNAWTGKASVVDIPAADGASTIKINTITISLKNTYTITKNANSEQGYIEGDTLAMYLEQVALTATPNYGYHFTQWSDGNAYNPRWLVLTQDTVLTAEFAPNQYQLTTSISNPEAGTASGTGTYNYGSYAELYATANYGYHFTQWNNGNTDNPRVVQVTGNKTYTAYFDKNTYTITKNASSEQGHIEGINSAKYLDQVTLTVVPNYGYHFTQWSDGNTDNPRSIVITQDTTFTAEFDPNQYTITTTSSHPNRGTTQGDATVNYLEYISISAEADYGYHFTQWSDGNTDNPRIEQVTGNEKYTAYFAENTYYITTNANNGQGYIDSDSSAEYLDQVTLTATPNYGYHFTQWSDGNTDNPRSIVITQDTTFTAEFAPNQYTITTTSSHPNRGTTQGDATVNYLENVTISATANYGYHFTHWDDENTQNPRQILSVGKVPIFDADVDNEGVGSDANNATSYTITKDGVTITVSSGILGSTSNKKHYRIYKNQTLTVTSTVGNISSVEFTCIAVDNAQYGPGCFSCTLGNYTYSGAVGIWNGNADQIVFTASLAQVRATQIIVKVGNYLENMTYTAYFDKNTYNIITQCDALQGTVNSPSVGEYLDQVALTATENCGYHFTQWSDGNADNPRTLVLTQDTVLTAEFAINQYCLSTSISNPEAGIVNGTGIYSHGAYAELSAIANYGYHFTQWSDGNTDNPRVVQVTEDKTYTAYFAKNTYSIAGNYNTEQGYISGASSAAYLDQVTLTATPNYGYHFTQWSDGNAENPRSIVITQDTTFTAEFAINQYHLSTSISNPEAGIVNGTGIYSHGAYAELSAIPNYGYHFLCWSDGNTDNQRRVLVTEDKTYTAYFAKNTYSIAGNYNTEQGYISGASSAAYLDQVTLIATPNYGYHFTQWSDGNTENPRSIVITQDTTFTAEFAINQYYLSTSISNPEAGIVIGTGSYNYGTYAELHAASNYGYHFTQWSDGNTDNPRRVLVTEDKTYTVYFDKNTYSITKNTNSEQGYIEGVSSAAYLDQVTLTATPNDGYHFTQWSDGVIDNPRTLVLTQDITLTAEFAPNQYTVTTFASHSERGTTQGDTIVNYLEFITISATANYGYHFTHWNDGNTENPRQVQVTGDETYTAEFEKNTYSVSLSCNNELGSVKGATSAKYLDAVTISATPNVGYHFVQWNDGNTDNPRALVLTKDITLTAEFAQTFSGQCGENLYWNYDETTKTISINGSGEMYDYTANTQPWLLFKEQIVEVTTTNSVTSIGTSAFEGCARLGKISLGTGLEEITANAFAGCTRLYDIYTYATYPPFAEESSFANYNVYVYVPCEYQRGYTLDVVWGKFKFIECIGAESEPSAPDTVIVNPGTNDVTITWPTTENADTYSLVINKAGEPFCTLTFNQDGQLLNIAFAPSREGNNRPVQYAEQTVNGYRFTVTGLTEATKYAYDITTKDAANKTIATYSGEFTTKSNVTTDMENIQSPVTTCQKIMHNGQLIILRDGKTYTTMGAEIQ